MNKIPITDTDELNSLCVRLASSEYLTVDTEFLRTSTYYSKLCLIQIANENGAWAIDPLAEKLDLTAFYQLLNEGSPIKVFHASRQDIEIFYQATGKVPTPLFDTQLAAMVCGFGDSAGYEMLVKSILQKSIDKSVRLTDWSRRPLNDRQIEYALSDVTHLRDIYKTLKSRVLETKRSPWLIEEMKILNNPETYAMRVENAWLRIKTKSNNKRFIGYIRALGTWRENEAQSRNIPRNRVLRDEVLLEIAAHPPMNSNELSKIRNLPKRYISGPEGVKILKALSVVIDLPENQLPQPTKRKNPNDKAGPALDLLKVLLKDTCQKEGVAAKLLASSDDLEAMATSSHDDIPALHGWRYELFGKNALALLKGKLALTADGSKVKILKN
ncbi:MAG: ribonuclease D [Sphingomonadales bacterium]